jgi:predicted RNase H-like HicB family nuclease
MHNYSISLMWSDEDDCYIATIPELPELSSHGETAEEALEQAKIAAEGYVDILAEDGDPIPEPLKVKSYSGNLRVRLPKSLHERLAKEAEREGASLNSSFINLLSGTLARQETYETIISELYQTMKKVQLVSPYPTRVIEVQSENPEMVSGFWNYLTSDNSIIGEV